MTFAGLCQAFSKEIEAIEARGEFSEAELQVLKKYEGKGKGESAGEFR